MKNITISYAFAMVLIYSVFSVIGWSYNAGEWSYDLRIICGTFIMMFWIAFWMKIEHDREMW